MPAALNLNTARVFVHDIARARAFFADSLGLPLRAYDAARGYCVFDAGQCQLVIESVAADAPAEARARVGRCTGLSFLVPSVHVAHQDLTARGVVFSGPPQRQFWGGTTASFRDPDGNEYQIVQRGPR